MKKMKNIKYPRYFVPTENEARVLPHVLAWKMISKNKTVRLFKDGGVVDSVLTLETFLDDGNREISEAEFVLMR